MKHKIVPKIIAGFLLGAVIVCTAGCSQDQDHIVERERTVSGFNFIGIRSGEWVWTKTDNGALVRKVQYNGFKMWPLFIGHTTVLYPATITGQASEETTPPAQ